MDISINDINRQTNVFLVEISDGKPVMRGVRHGPRFVIDSFEVFADTLLDALAEGYMQVDNDYIQVYGPSVAGWMEVRLTHITTGKRSRWYTVDALGKAAA